MHNRLNRRQCCTCGITDMRQRPLGRCSKNQAELSSTQDSNWWCTQCQGALDIASADDWRHTKAAVATIGRKGIGGGTDIEAEGLFYPKTGLGWRRSRIARARDIWSQIDGWPAHNQSHAVNLAFLNTWCESIDKNFVDGNEGADECTSRPNRD